MPETTTKKYEWGGWRILLLYSEQEMADALALTRDELRTAIARGEYTYHSGGRHGWSDVPREYQFNYECYADNLAMQTCRAAGGHVWLWVRAGRAVCADCPAEKYT